MPQLLSKISTWKFIIPAILIYLVFGLYLFPKYQQQILEITGEELQILDLRFSYTQAEVQELFTKLKPAGRAAYQEVASIVDMIYPFAYGFLMILILAYLLKNLFGRNSNWLYLALSPILVMVLDFFENSNTLKMLASFPEISAELVEKGALFTSLKWSAVLVCLAILVLSGLGLLVKRFQNN